MKPAPRPHALSPLMRRVLRDVVEGRGTHWNCSGQSEHGGRERVLQALRRRGLIDGKGEATALGRGVLAALDGPPG